MKQNKTITIEKGLFSLAFVLILTSYASAFAISSAYYEGNPLRLNPGESREFTLTLQNMVGEGDVNAQATILKGSPVVQLTDSDATYSVPFGTKTKANFLAEIPADAQIGQVYDIEVEFKTIASQESGEFKFGSGISQKFQIEVVALAPVVTEVSQEQAQEIYESSNSGLIIGVIIVIVLIIVVFLIFYLMKKKK